ncbi:MAG TPA: hypothetical protein ENJ95_07140 [Bacteroidetes bacterium]|nr:hypothetical protein [Bacteroidota bacterium]
MVKWLNGFTDLSQYFEMNISGLNKNKKIIAAINCFYKKYGAAAFIIKDHWEDDFNAIGLADISGKHLIYFSINIDEEVFYAALEKPSGSGDFPYEPAGEFVGLSLEGLGELVVGHLNKKV